jgi:hypothetical protein
MTLVLKRLSTTTAVISLGSIVLPGSKTLSFAPRQSGAIPIKLGSLEVRKAGLPPLFECGKRTNKERGQARLPDFETMILA